MSPRPGVEVISRAQPLPRTAPTDTGGAFMIAETETGADVKLVRSMTEYEDEFGMRTGFDVSYDAADAYFREGGAKLTVSRTNGTLVFTAPNGPDDLSDEALAGATRADLDAIAEGYGLDPTGLPSKDAVIQAIKEATTSGERQVSARSSHYLDTLLAADPAIAAALAALTADYGPGQIFAAHSLGSDQATQEALLAHAEATNRVALLHCADGDVATMSAAAALLRANVSARYGALFAPHVQVPGVAGSTTRDVAYDAIEAGIIARNDVSFTPNIAAAGVNGQALFATDVNLRFSDFDYEDLNEAGVNMARMIYDGVRTYGYRTLVDPASPDAVWLELNHARLNMAIVAQAEAIAERYVFSQLDGRYRTIADFGGELAAMLVPFYEAGALYGETADDAFMVNVGPSVNTPTTIANGELHAVIQVRMSPFAELVVIEIVKVSTVEALAA